CLLLCRLDPEAPGDGAEEPQATFGLHGVDLLALVLAGLPVGRKLADRVGREVRNRDAVGWLRGRAQCGDGHEQGERRHGGEDPHYRPRRHQWCTRLSTTSPIWAMVRHSRTRS